jgi:hypothetical protein
MAGKKRAAKKAAKSSKGAPIVAKILEISPEQAMKWLNITEKAIAKNEFKNRPISQSTVDTYVHEIKSGNWKVNGETVKITHTGVVVDGQHRLWSIFESGMIVESLVVKATDEESSRALIDSFETIDRGRTRTVGHILAIEGEKHSREMAAALNWLHRYRNMIMTSGTTGRGSLTGSEARELLEREPGLRDSLMVMDYVRKLISPSVMVFAHYIFSQEHPDLAKLFMMQLGEGTGLSKSDPVYALREKLLVRRTQIKKAPMLEVLAWTFKAWHATIMGRTFKEPRHLHWRRQSTELKAGEDFPYLQVPAARKKAKKKKAAAARKRAGNKS